MSEQARPSLAARVAKVAGLGVVIVLALVTILTALRTELPRSPGVMSDALGPDAGEPVAAYLQRAAATLDAGGPAGGGGGGRDHNRGDDDNTVHPDLPTGPQSPRWALISADQAWTVANAETVARDLPRVSAVVVQTPVDGVAMPVTEVVMVEPVAGDENREQVLGRALERAEAEFGVAAEAGSDRGSQAAALTADRIAADEPAIIGLLVRAATGQLRAVAELPGVRAVDALPDDAVWGQFAVRPLLPQQTRAADPLPDHTPVPAR